jgi:hypothetical protein
MTTDADCKETPTVPTLYHIFEHIDERKERVIQRWSDIILLAKRALSDERRRRLVKAMYDQKERVTQRWCDIILLGQERRRRLVKAMYDQKERVIQRWCDIILLGQRALSDERRRGVDRTMYDQPFVD